jgi:heptosyltransferase III
MRHDRAMGSLVVHSGGIGDFLLACPVLMRLAEDGPLELAGAPERLSLAADAGIAQAVHSLDRIGFHTAFAEPSETLREFVSRFGRIVVWMNDNDGGLARTLRRLTDARCDVHPGLPPADWRKHASEYYLDQLGFPAGPPLRLAFEPAPHRRDVILHPGSGGKHKNWPLENFVEVARILKKRGRCVAWCLGPAEQALELPPDAERIEAVSLTALARILAAARLYIGNDSGITHLAAAAGCPTVAIFGPTDPAVWAPRGGAVRVLQTASFARGTSGAWPSVRTVLEASR